MIAIADLGSLSFYISLSLPPVNMPRQINYPRGRRCCLDAGPRQLDASVFSGDNRALRWAVPGLRRPIDAQQYMNPPTTL